MIETMNAFPSLGTTSGPHQDVGVQSRRGYSLRPGRAGGGEGGADDSQWSRYRGKV